MRKMRKIGIAMLATVMALSFTACEGTKKTDDGKKTETTEVVAETTEEKTEWDIVNSIKPTHKSKKNKKGSYKEETGGLDLSNLTDDSMWEKLDGYEYEVVFYDKDKLISQSNGEKTEYYDSYAEFKEKKNVGSFTMYKGDESLTFTFNSSKPLKGKTVKELFKEGQWQVSNSVLYDSISDKKDLKKNVDEMGQPTEAIYTVSHDDEVGSQIMMFLFYECEDYGYVIMYGENEEEKAVNPLMFAGKKEYKEFLKVMKEQEIAPEDAYHAIVQPTVIE